LPAPAARRGIHDYRMGKQVCVWNHDLSLIIGLDDRRAGLNFLNFF
jgi:hypothetical protein